MSLIISFLVILSPLWETIAISSPSRYHHLPSTAAPRSLSHVLPGASLVGVPRDGQCCLHTIAIGDRPDIPDTNPRVLEVRSQLLGELQQWGKEMWFERIPWHDLRKWLFSHAGPLQTSYDVYLEYLSRSISGYS